MYCAVALAYLFYQTVKKKLLHNLLSSHSFNYRLSSLRSSSSAG